MVATSAGLDTLNHNGKSGPCSLATCAGASELGRIHNLVYTIRVHDSLAVLYIYMSSSKSCNVFLESKIVIF